MDWQGVGHDGSTFREQVAASPGWYWVCRPLQLGPGSFDPAQPIVMPVWVDEEGQIHSPLTDLASLDESALLCPSQTPGARYETFFAGPVHPGALAGRLRAPESDDAPIGWMPDTLGWHWCRTHGPLQHVDQDGVGPVFMARSAKGEVCVYAASTPAGQAVDIFEIGFTEPLVTRWGVIDATGEAGRREAEFFGPIAAPTTAPPAFPLIQGD